MATRIPDLDGKPQHSGPVARQSAGRELLGDLVRALP